MLNGNVFQKMLVKPVRLILGSRLVTQILQKRSLFLSTPVLVGIALLSFTDQLAFPQNGLENLLSPNNAIGLPPYTTTDGQHEDVALASGALNVTIPLLSLPQRGGSVLNLAYIYNSKNWALEQSDSETTSSSGLNVWYQSQCAFGACDPTAPLKLNLPTLQADIKYVGMATWENYGLGYYNYYPQYCVAGWVFTDWSGAEHQFSNQRDCPAILGYETASGVFTNITSFQSQNLTESQDASFIRLDTSNPSDIVAIEKDGTQYHFYGYTLPAANQGDQPGYYFAAFSKMVDLNGNTVTYSAGTLTDTLNRQITFGSGIQYHASDGTGQAITSSIEHGASSIYTFLNPPSGNGSGTCNFDSSAPPTSPYQSGGNGGYSFYSRSITYGPGWQVNGYASTTETISFPGGRQLALTFDVLGQLTEIQYPGGGYTRYDYQNYPSYQDNGNITCNSENHQVSAKHVCSNAGGCSSSQEATTTYTPNVTGTFNAQMQVSDPYNNLTKYEFTEISYGQTAPRETDRFVYSGQSTLLRTIHTDYVNLGQSNDMALPSKVTTTFNDASPALVSSVSMQYDTQNVVPSSSCPGWSQSGYDDNYVSYCFGPGPINNPTLIQETDFNGNIVRTTSKTWEKGGNYDGGTGHILDRLESSVVTDPVTGNLHTSGYTYDTHGNVTTTTDSGTNAASNTVNYQPLDPWGRPTQAVDSLNHTYLYSYNTDATWSNSACAPPSGSLAYLTSVTNPAGQVTTYKYNSCTGTLGSITDPNSQTTSYSYDGLGRTVAANYPDQGETTTCYGDAPPNTITTDVAMNASGKTGMSSCQVNGGNVVNETVLDGLGRKSETELLSDPYGPVLTQTTYDFAGNVASATNPYRTTSDQTYGITSYLYDALDRKVDQCQPDNSSQSSTICVPQNDYQSWNYIGNTVTFKDENGNQWLRTADALGRITQVLEPSGVSTAPSMETDYGYDGFGNLLSATQWGGAKGSAGARQRTFSYDGRSRLITASNPETGTVTYGPYDADGNLSAKTDARGVATTYGYDQLNRILSKSYSSNANGTPLSCYQYDSTSVTNGIGRLANAWTVKASSSCASAAPTSGFLTMRSILKYDPMGRLWNEQQYTPASQASGKTYAPAYTYDLAGHLQTSTDGSTPSPTTPGATLTFTNAFDGAGRLLTVTSNWFDSTTHPSTLFSAQTETTTYCSNSSTLPYSPFGGLWNATFGTGASGSVYTLNRGYDTRMRPTCEVDTGSGVQP